ncbi:pyruvate oxidase [Loigolactobacillus coryniformis]|jgi:pyruvate oxidase|uniref:Pyruvate oxidase n=2 Tax=Loigolactobacillus TaxID=2767889 RepID=A0A2D1KRY2_9LACO|nr:MULTISPECIES: pyruvate oxidase [Loigolactobacillus]ATO44812.1 pyruvate oxidase [Loigolactobacillus coryniformis subsp. torquens DSM 20004 = KCTC 3535]KRK77662.1 pyruvate oxidase [Loigolactobacillus coryniformis subsp. torquens DSM 20004 = KCTC 3535]MCL5459350.1 pyruvate oxidase [Loigolactobacillus coryniformis]MDT3390998.1 pyruvate oxidase [Bacillota bacterium]
MSDNKISAGLAALKVMSGWGVHTMYGIPSGTLSGLMNAMGDPENKIKFLQVKHEEVGAMAAVMQWKFGGKLGVAVGSGGPGATHLINGLYDAAMDNIPVLAILGSKPVRELNMDSFQELNQNPMYDNIAVYNRRVATAEQLPHLVDDAIRTAIAKRGVAVLEVPADFGFTEIDADSLYSTPLYSSGVTYKEYKSAPVDESDISAAVDILNQAKRPVIYAGIGTMGHGSAVQALSRKMKAPIITTGKNFETFDWDFEGFTGSTFRVGWKPANEAILEADNVLFVGTNFPFSEVEGTFRNVNKFIQIDNNPAMLGKRHQNDVAILGDAGEAIAAILAKVSPVNDSPWWQANVANVKNWRDYMNKLEQKTEGDLQAYQVYNAINKYAADDAIFSIDVGNVTQMSVRHLHMTDKNMWRTSPLFATMGIGLPGGIGAKNTYPDRQVWNLMGDGAFSMTYPDVVTNVRYKLPVINVVFTNTEYGFIKNKYEDTNTYNFGVDFTDVDYAKIAEAQGAVGLTVSRIEDIDQVMKEALDYYNQGRVVVVDAKITKDRPIPVETLKLDTNLYSESVVEAYKEKYEAQDLVPFREYLEAQGMTSRYIKDNNDNKYSF